MTLEIGATLTILTVSIILFIREKLRVDLIGLMVFSALVITGLVTFDQALAGFSNPAVVTVWAIFILSAGLTYTGIASKLGRLVLRYGGSNWGMLLVMMLVSVFLSAFMNNVGVTAMLLPVVLDVSRRTKQAPSKLLLPLAFSSMFGGLITSIGTPPNILIVDMLSEAGFETFRLFDFAPMGLVISLAGILFFLLFSRWLLPSYRPISMMQGDSDEEIDAAFSLDERIFIVNIPENSSLTGKTLAESRVGAALRLNVIGIIRAGETHLAPDAQMILQAADRLLVVGRPDELEAIGDGRQFELEQEHLPLEELTSTEVHLAEISLSSRSKLIGQTLEQMNFRSWIGANVLAIWRDDSPIRMELQALPLRATDRLLIQTRTAQLAALRDSPDFLVSKADSTHVYHLEDRLLMLHVPARSHFANKTLMETNLADAYGLTVLGIVRDGETKLMPQAHDVIEVGDHLLVKGRPEEITAFRGLQSLEVASDEVPSVTDIQSEKIGMVEVVLSPHSALVGKSLRVINFRERYGLSVLALWRGGRPYRYNFRDMALQFGDALLIYGQRSRLQLLAEERDFLVLTDEIKAEPRSDKAWLAALIMLGVVVVVLLGLLPIAIAAVIGGVLMVLTGCLSMDEAYRSIEWKAVFLVAGMLPLGIAMQTTGTADYLASLVLGYIAPFGAYALMVGLFTITAAGAQFMPNSAIALIMGPIALTTAIHLGYSPQAMLMLIAIASSSSFISPIGHHVNIIVMGPGSYRFKDYVKVGLPLTLLVLLVTLLVLPIFWPL